MDNINLITRLYALRGGLSIMSKNADILKAQENVIEDKNLNLEELYDEQGRFSKKIKIKIEQNEARKIDYLSQLNNINSREKENEKPVKPYQIPGGKLAMFGWCMLSLIVLGSTLSGVWIRIDLDTLRLNNPFIQLFFCAIICIFSLFVPVLIIKRKLKAERNEERKDILANKNRIIKEIKDCEHNKTDLIKRLKESVYIEKIKNIRSEINDLQTTLEKEGQIVTKANDDLCAVYSKEYGDILQEADWKNVDLILFYLETGRADTLKEALQQVDNQRQTEAIVKAIGSATEYIGRMIESNFQTLISTMVQCFNHLYATIEHNQKLMFTELNKISSVVQDLNSNVINISSNINKYVESVSDKLDVQNCLLEKANISSDQLYNDLRYTHNFKINVV